MADQDLIKTEVDKKALEDLTKPAKPATAPKPDLKKADIEAAIPLLVDVEASKGYLKIAQAVGIPVSDVKLIHQAMRARISELTPIEDEPVEVVEVIK